MYGKGVGAGFHNFRTVSSLPIYSSAVGNLKQSLLMNGNTCLACNNIKKSYAYRVKNVKVVYIQ